MTATSGKRAALLTASLISALPVGAQQPVAPDQGGTILSLGQPPKLKPYGGLSLGGYFENQASDLTAGSRQRVGGW